MSYKTGILLGQITKVIGFDGAVALKQENILAENLTYMEPVFLEIEGRPVPFFIAEYDSPGGEMLRLKFDGYDTPGMVKEFVGCRVFLTRRMEVEKEASDWLTLAGYKVFSRAMEHIGMVENVVRNPGQWLLEIRSLSGKSFLVPLHEDLITSIDEDKKEMILDIPEGLMEIN